MAGGGGGGYSATGVKKARIEIIPLIDIIFFLLATFIMVSLSMTKNQGIQVALPAAAAAQSLGDQSEMDEAVTLSVNEKGEIFYNKEKVSVAQLSFKLQLYQAQTKDPRVIVTGDAAADFKTIVAVLDEARRVGIPKVGISTDTK
jgi:biopolymer transport protein ExbD